MKKKIMALNNKGQALIESLIIFLSLVVIISGLLFGAYSFMILEWSDYWVYRSTICLAQREDRALCLKKLNDKLNVLIPKNYFVVKEIWKTPKEAKTTLEIYFAYFKIKKRVTSSLQLPLPTH